MPAIRGYRLPIFVRQTAATAAATPVWAMRNVGAAGSIPNRPVYLRRIAVNAMFDGTAAASTSRYELVRHRTATYTGGTPLTVIKNNTDDPASAVTDARFADTGLTVGSVTVDTFAAAFGAPRQVGACAQYVQEWPGMNGGQNSGAFIIKPTDGIALLLGVTAVIGDSISGWLEWDEVGGAF